MAYCFSFFLSPGVMNRHNSHSHTGAASAMPMYKDTFNRVVKPSVGLDITSWEVIMSLWWR